MLDSPIESLKIYSRFIPKLSKLGIFEVKDLLYHFPHRYENFGEVKNIKDARPGQKITIQGKILKTSLIRTAKRRMQIFEALIEDETGSIKAVWFNQGFLKDVLRKGACASLSGKIDFGSGSSFVITNPAYEIIPADEGAEAPAISAIQTGGLIPVYPETEGLSSRWLRTKISSILHLADEIAEFIPQEILNRQNLIGISEAIRQAHFPGSEEMKNSARKRLAFEELFLMQTCLKKEKKNWQENAAINIKFNQELIKNFVGNLPFKLTGAQKKAAWEILRDLEKPFPMNRLLEGDVGSGKTVVAAIAALEAASAGLQTAIMAPTEVLARQHYNTLAKLLPDVPIALLTNSYSKFSAIQSARCEMQDTNLPSCKTPQNRKKIIGEILSGNIKIIIGTHSLIQKDVIFKNLALAVVDEQHRFGVSQRAALQKKAAGLKDETPSTVPHLLTMTATPIPRTLALSVYGDLDLSIIDEMPAGRQKIITRVVAPGNRRIAYDFTRQEIKKGRQAFVVCPLIEESEKLEVKSVTEEFEKLSTNIFKEFRIAMLHGKMKADEKENIMSRFKNRQIDILISTSVIEVGIDVPNATIMIIEGSERFGLAQLHQFRGRVGRGEIQSCCLLFTDSTSRAAHQRLKALVSCSSGFELAQKDLDIRGPGEFIGCRQSGIPDLAMASLNDVKMVQAARQEAEFAAENLDAFPELKKKIEEFEKRAHLE